MGSRVRSEGLTVEVHQLIFRNSDGSWVRDANWDEYVLMISTYSQDTVELLNINLYSDRLLAPVESSTSREQLRYAKERGLRARCAYEWLPTHRARQLLRQFKLRPKGGSCRCAPHW